MKAVGQLGSETDREEDRELAGQVSNGTGRQGAGQAGSQTGKGWDRHAC
jgi:hypothetical protein